MRRNTFLLDESKSILLKYINNCPGIRYRELQRATGFANGVLAYHLKILEKSRRMLVMLESVFLTGKEKEMSVLVDHSS
jgi:predicted transcriptional regulator